MVTLLHLLESQPCFDSFTVSETKTTKIVCVEEMLESRWFVGDSVDDFHVGGSDDVMLGDLVGDAQGPRTIGCWGTRDV